MTRSLAVLLMCSIVAAAPAAWAADRPPTPVSSLPLAPGARPVLEVNVSDADLLPAIKQSLPAIVGALPKLLGMPEGVFLEPAEAEVIFRDVQSLEALVAAVPPQPDGKPSAPAVAQFYEATLAEQGWRRLFWMQPGGDAAAQILIMSPKLEQGLFGVIVGTEADGRSATAIAFRMRGSVNLAPVIGRIVSWMAKRGSPEPVAAPPKE